MNSFRITHDGRIGRALTLAASLALALTLGTARRADAVACSTSICTSTGTNTCSIANTTLDSGCPGVGPCVLDWGSSMDVTISGTLNADALACDLTLAANSFTVSGTIRKQTGTTIVNTSGAGEFFSTTGSGGVDARKNGSFTVNSGGTCTHGGGDITAAGQSPICSGGFVWLNCGALSITKGINADGACGGDDSGDGGTLWFTASTGSASFSGNGNVTANASGSETFGGWIDIDVATTLSQGKTMQAKGGNDGSGGEISMVAGGATTSSGALNVVAAGGYGVGGTVSIGGTLVTVSGAISDNGGYSGGSVGVYGTQDISVTGNIDSSGGGGGPGGYVTIWGDEDSTIDGTVNVGSGGTYATGGAIDFIAGNNHTLAIEKVLTTTVSAGGDANGSIDFDACNIVIHNDLRSRNVAVAGGQGGGTNWLRYKGTFTQTSGDSILADDPALANCAAPVISGNRIDCRCPDANADLVCDSATCVSAPTLSGTVTPTALICPMVLPACG